MDKLKIKLTRKLLDKFKFASNETPNHIKDFKNYEILTKSYGYDMGLVWCWNDKKHKGILFRFEHSEDKEVKVDETFAEVSFN